MFPFAIVPPFVLGGSEKIKQIACCSNNTILLTTKGNVYVTGMNRIGELGVGDKVNRYNTWVLVMQGVNHVAAVSEAVFSFRTDGTVWSPNKQLESPQWEDVTTSQFANVGDLSGDNIRQVISDNENIVIWKKDNVTWYSGTNSAGQAGNGQTGTVGQAIKMQEDVQKISVSGNTIVIKKSDGFLYGSGSNERSIIAAGAGPLLTFTKMFGSHADGGDITDFVASPRGQAILVRYSNGKYRTKGLNIGQLPTGSPSPGDTLTEVPIGHTPGDGTEPMICNIPTKGVSGSYTYPLYYYTGGEFYGAGSASGGLAGVNVASGTIPWTQFDPTSVKLPNMKGMSFGLGWAIAYNDKQVIYWGSTASPSTIPIVGYVAVSTAVRPSYRALYATSPING